MESILDSMGINGVRLFPSTLPVTGKTRTEGVLIAWVVLLVPCCMKAGCTLLIGRAPGCEHWSMYLACTHTAILNTTIWPQGAREGAINRSQSYPLFLFYGVCNQLRRYKIMAI